MKLEQKIKQQQKLILSSHMQQFMHVLHLNNLELLETISDEVEINPFLAQESPVPFCEEFSQFKPRDFSSNFEESLEDIPSLIEQIETQISLNFHDLQSQSIAKHMIFFLDEAGYFRADIEELAKNLGTDVKNIKRILNIMQSFDPSGIFARDLKECFKIQLAQQEEITPTINAIIDKLDFLISGNMKDLLKESGSNLAQVQDVIQKLRHLDPKPGFQSSFQISVFNSGNIIPDIYLDIDEFGKWNLRLNSDLMPKLSLDKELFHKMRYPNLNKEQESFIKEKFATASNLIKIIRQRNETLLRIANEVVRTQRLFFTQGIHFLKPLTLRKVAEQINVNESTISRGCSNKYISTPRGTFELKFFFQSGVTDTDGDAVSAAQIIHKIKKMIHHEPHENPHSDSKLTILLNTQGIQVARRTVAKYREESGIPSSSIRKRQKSL